ncbi:MAG: hypothetical protein A3H69_05695 [Candidatus Sungbacteria bacterium RIFCSPLOWO2_02_FULL_47_9]|uniref:DUF5666 domain-containing protein n=1 Tax=Candidatus Sungbacteria bacterium RIFCSPHIGHO2_01_FULL_47_32 TaxID=1802264 RepID=A0A1G2K970_9BACT|nr:MAG: hypothetical protein UX72_C0004G0060 [Parcubacteria group bacterium GW2011_GWA2_47_10]OGZ95773.1 MAG: hypothetical protein A2633_00570 [Candidatus Sungbacteria bacterium RIFCSPHIGHO2_01_FULL_47_32]OGZ99088.1 MAG: hypothetical protein A3D57_03495 [Candidatus Sungbacteria bacterium RIFCSPHIGHO2_02_FULL_46_12]OHA04580.1 MAG: hypothetical protein A3A28_01315 [Candidatus Sungbacteria bacterium RIFCSPLOWO2_01_FULL_47_32]OHA10125.1 MAG: hypothetical protein A3H69_05695 [Candidatus Sungbacteria
MNLDFTQMNKLFGPITSKRVLKAIVCVVLLLLAFKAGEVVGFNKARFSYRWGENYHRNFGGPRNGFMRDFRRDIEGKDFISPHGTFGSIIKIDGNMLIVKGKDNTEKTVLLSERTSIKIFANTANPEELKVNDTLTIIGSPNEQGQIKAEFIRVFR